MNANLTNLNQARRQAARAAGKKMWLYVFDDLTGCCFKVIRHGRS